MRIALMPSATTDLRSHHWGTPPKITNWQSAADPCSMLHVDTCGRGPERLERDDTQRAHGTIGKALCELEPIQTAEANKKMGAQAAESNTDNKYYRLNQKHCHDLSQATRYKTARSVQ